MSCPQHTQVYIPGVGWVKKSDLQESAKTGKDIPVVLRAYDTEQKSRAMSVHRTQAAKYNEMARSRGIHGVRWDENGDCYVASRRSRNRWLQATHRLDMDAGYGDYAGS